MELRVQEYIDGVQSGEIVVNKYIRLAVKRHTENLERQRTKEFPYYFDEYEAKRIINFFGYLKHWKGEWADKPIILEPWQQFYLWDLFGWRRVEDDTRKYRKSSLWVARKNGKTTLAAGIGLFGLMKDREAGPQIYTVATKAEQAAICFDDAKKISEKSSSIEKRLDNYKYSITHPDSGGFMKYFGADSSTMDGFDPYYCIADEVHAHKTDGVLEIMESGMGSRRQPLMLEISTTGHILHGVGKNHYDYSAKVLEEIIEDEAWHAMVFTLDEDDDWKDEKVWQKANPNLGVSKKVSYMESQFTQALSMPGKESKFKTKDLNLWVSSKTGFIPNHKWQKCNNRKVTVDDLKGRKCYAGLDLGEISDFTAFAVLAEPLTPEDKWLAKLWYWIPELTLRERKNVNIIMPWVDDGWITTTNGNATDYDAVQSDIEGLLDVGVNIKKLFYDSSKAQNMPSKIDAEYDGIEVASVSQSGSKMNAPIEGIMKFVFDEMIEFGNDPVLSWMNSNVVVVKNYNDQKRFDKKKANDKMDGMVALAMAFMPVVDEQEEETEYYAGHGMLA